MQLASEGKLENWRACVESALALALLQLELPLLAFRGKSSMYARHLPATFLEMRRYERANRTNAITRTFTHLDQRRQIFDALKWFKSTTTNAHTIGMSSLQEVIGPSTKWRLLSSYWPSACSGTPTTSPTSSSATSMSAVCRTRDYEDAIVFLSAACTP
jgi:hypothetical protein